MDITTSLGTLSPALLGLVPIIIALTQIVKSFVSDERYIPLVALVLGLLGAVLVDGIGYIGTTVVEGLIVGLTASGLYSGVKKTVNG